MSRHVKIPPYEDHRVHFVLGDLRARGISVPLTDDLAKHVVDLHKTPRLREMAGAKVETVDDFHAMMASGGPPPMRVSYEHPLLATDAHRKTVAAVDDALAHAFLGAIAAEIKGDPERMGYAGKGDEETAALMSGPRVRETERRSRLEEIAFPFPVPSARTVAELIADPTPVHSSDGAETLGHLYEVELRNDARYRQAFDDAAVFALLEARQKVREDLGPARSAVIFPGLPYAPNTVTAENVAAARKV